MNIVQDQARKLRELVRHVDGTRVSERRSPAVVTIVGGCPQVGVTSIVTRLAAELARQSTRTAIQPGDKSLDDTSTGADIVLIDGGAGCSQEAASRWSNLDLVLLVVTGAREALLKTYETLKVATLANRNLPIYLVPNQCLDASEAESIHQRISVSCERFLGFAVPAATWMPMLHFESQPEDSNPNLVKLARFVIEHTLIEVPVRTHAA